MAEKKKKKHKKKKHKFFWHFVRFQILLMFIVGAGLMVYFFGGYADTINGLHEEAVQLVKDSTVDTFKQNQTSVVYDANLNQISKVKGEKDVYYLNFEDIPADVVDALISIEDKKFYKHHGIDFKAIIRAAVSMVKNGEVKQGGSTITQQLARTVFLSNERSLRRKIEEIFIAAEMEQKYTKNQILEFYLNNVYFGNGFYGIEAAAEGYFSEKTRNLSLSQMCFLCGIPNNPTLYNPLNNIENTIGRRNRILKQMKLDGVISDRTFKDAVGEEITIKQPEVTRHNYIETYTYYCATRALMKQRGFTFRNDFQSEEEKATYNEAYDILYEECQASLFTAGYRIYTSIDLEMQDKLQEAIDNNLSEYEEVDDNGTYKLQSAGTCIDNETGLVVAIVGGRSQEHSGYTLNRAFQSFRQPGSSIKPLVVYTPAFEAGYTPDSIVEDKKIKDGPGQSSYLGKISIRTAVEKSKNSVAWQLFDELTPRVGLQYLLNMNFSKICSDDYYLPAALGGLTIGASTLEMASGYATIENDGYYREPSCISRITDAQGNVIYEYDESGKAVYGTNESRMMTDVLTGVLIRGTAAGKGLGDMPSAGKTGTTNDNKDGWFCGFTHYYTTSIWVGYDTPKRLDSLQGSSYPATIWHDYMMSIHEGLPVIDFLPYVGGNGKNKVDKKEKKEKVEIIEPEEEETDDEETITEPEDNNGETTEDQPITDDGGDETLPEITE